MNSSFLNNDSFKKDLYKYNLFGTLLLRKKYEKITDNVNYAIITFENGITWLWTKDKIDESLIDTIAEKIPDTGEIIYKKNIESILNKHIEETNHEEFGCYYCDKAVKPIKEVKGKMIKASSEDVYELAELWLLNCEEADPINKYYMTDEKAIKFIKTWMEDEEFYVWKDESGAITCFASYKNIDNTSRIEHAYTKKKYRNLGYMSNLIYGMTRIILEEKRIPVLQTDINYVASNKSYKNVGFILDDIMLKSSYSLISKKTLY